MIWNMLTKVLQRTSSVLSLDSTRTAYKTKKIWEHTDSQAARKSYKFRTLIRGGICTDRQINVISVKT
jgi:hypothetical protein